MRKIKNPAMNAGKLPATYLNPKVIRAGKVAIVSSILRVFDSVKGVKICSIEIKERKSEIHKS